MKFIALPVGSGDAFYAETDDGFRVLVDGGRSRRELPHLFQLYTRRTDVDVLVCTHNDADHAEGLIGFLESGLFSKELWLPATWLEAVRSLPDDPAETILFLWKHLHSAWEQGVLPEAQERLDFQEVAWRSIFPEFNEPQPLKDNAQARETSEGQEVLPFDAHLDETTIAALEEHLAFFAAPWPPWYWWREDWGVPSRVFPLVAGPWFAVAQDVRRLLELGWLALNHGIPVRCFQHDPANAGRIMGTWGWPLQPLSARPSCYIPAAKPAKSAERFFRLAFLTTVNRESLVFYLDGGNGLPGVLFTADSDLKDVNVDHVLAWSTATAPHHGSHDNRSAYSRINKLMVWIRSDGYSKARPCVEFLQAPGRRLCTLCRNSEKPKQAVRLYQRRGSWVRLRTRLCECR